MVEQVFNTRLSGGQLKTVWRQGACAGGTQWVQQQKVSKVGGESE